MRMNKKTYMLIGLAALAYYLYTQKQANAGVTTGLFGPGGYGTGSPLPTGSLSPQGFPAST
jgi:hypothetical protein